MNQCGAEGNVPVALMKQANKRCSKKKLLVRDQSKYRGGQSTTIKNNLRAGGLRLKKKGGSQGGDWCVGAKQD